RDKLVTGVQTCALPILGDFQRFDFDVAQVSNLRTETGKFETCPTFFGALVQYPATDGAIYNYEKFAGAAHDAGALFVVAADILEIGRASCRERAEITRV